MMRQEQYCGGRLVKKIDQINMGGAATNFTDQYVDGRHVWLLDGEEVAPAEAEAFRARWETDAKPSTTT